MEKERTAHLGRALKQVYRGELTVKQCVELAEQEISEVFSKPPKPPEEDTDIGTAGEPVGPCPLCGKPVLRGRYSYGCSGYKEGCNFRLNLEICKRVIPISAARDLLQTGQTVKLKGFTSKNNKPFDAALKLENGKIIFNFN